MEIQKLVEVFEEVLKNWEMSQGCVITESCHANYDYQDLSRDVEMYRKRFLEALNQE
ncbi:hypothetical protein [Bacillus mobilis]|uniref:hypothetical protein n=1 Tax=Bacillus mobilis TaxID=2026190 RepID=UPI003CF94686